MSSAFESSWDFLKALNPMPNVPEIEGPNTPEEELRHYNNMQQQKAGFAVRPPHLRPPPRPMEEEEDLPLTDSEWQHLTTPRARPPMIPHPTEPAPTMSFEKAWGILKTGRAPLWSSTHQGYEEDPLLQGEDDLGDEPRPTADYEEEEEMSPDAVKPRAQPPIDVPPAPPQRPPRGQRTLDEF